MNASIILALVLSAAPDTYVCRVTTQEGVDQILPLTQLAMSPYPERRDNAHWSQTFNPPSCGNTKLYGGPSRVYLYQFTEGEDGTEWVFVSLHHIGSSGMRFIGAERLGTPIFRQFGGFDYVRYQIFALP